MQKKEPHHGIVSPYILSGHVSSKFPLNGVQWRPNGLTAWPSLVQVIVGDGIPKASQPRVRGCFKVTVRFSGWPSSWISGGTKEQRECYQSTFRHFLKRKKNVSGLILTIYFQPGLSFHRACLVGGHTLEIPAVTGRHFVNYESSVPCHR